MTSNNIIAMLLELIRNGTFSPGQRISIYRTADLLNISQTPIREALSNLSNDGIVLHQPSQGFFIPYYTEDDLENLYDFLYILLGASLNRSIKNLEHGDIKAPLESLGLLKLIDDTETWQDRDRSSFCMEEIFTNLSKLSGNKFLERSMQSCVIKTSFSRKIEYRDKMRRLSVKEDVLKILDHLYEGKKQHASRSLLSSQKQKSKIIRDIHQEYSVATCNNISSNQNL